jgi:hypothetical protein
MKRPVTLILVLVLLPASLLAQSRQPTSLKGLKAVVLNVYA